MEGKSIPYKDNFEISVLAALFYVLMDIRNIGYMEQFDQLPTCSL